MGSVDGGKQPINDESRLKTGVSALARSEWNSTQRLLRVLPRTSERSAGDAVVVDGKAIRSTEKPVFTPVDAR